MLHKIVEAGGQLKSFALAARMVELLAEVPISARHLADLTQQIGAELRDQRDRQTEDYVHHRRQPPAEAVPPAVAVGVDGGRLMTRVTTAGAGPGVHGHGWKEDKIACLHVLEGPTFAADPHPQPPRCFLDPQYVDELVRDFGADHALPAAEEVAAAAAESPAAAGGAAAVAGGSDIPLSVTATAAPACPPPPQAGPVAAGLPAATAGSDMQLSAAAAAGPAATPAGATVPGSDMPLSAAAAPATPCPPAPGPVDAPPQGPPADPAWPPQRTARTCVGTMRNSGEFAKMVAQEAYARNFFAAERRAFLGDGQHYNWSLQQKWFKDFVPIADFIHPLSYLYQTAMAVAGGAAAGWPLYVAWMTACWQGRVAEVIAALRDWQGRLGPGACGPGPPEADPAEVLRRTLTYLENNASRMDYPNYRCQGLPVMTATVESLVKEFNYRVKGTEKFWNHPEGAEAILQVRAAVLSDDERLEKYLRSRPGSPYRYIHPRAKARKAGENR